MAASEKENGEEYTLEPPSKQYLGVKSSGWLILEVLLLLVFLPCAILSSVYKKIFPPPSKSLKGQVALVTGASRGLGRSLAVALAKEGCKVAVVDIDMVGAEQTAKEIVDAAGVAKVYSCNVAKVEEVRALRKAVTEDLGPVQLLVNNAGLIAANSLDEASETIIRAVIEVNLLGQFWMVKEFIPSMRDHNCGHIVSISSASALGGLAKAEAYAASKFGIRGFMDSLRQEINAFPGNKIKTTTVYPYFINTSAHYVEHWDLRFPPLSIDEVVKATIEGVKREEVELTIPQHLFYVLQITSLLPQSVIDLSRRIFYCRIIPPSKEEKEQLRSTVTMKRIMNSL